LYLANNEAFLGETIMNYVIGTAILLVAVLHLYFLYLEMFQWTAPLGLKTFRNDAEFAKKSAVLAANQGLYNGFLAAGLIWSVISEGQASLHLKFFFLTCVIIAGIYGGYSANKKIFFIQALPAIIAIILVSFFA
jgi:putative membrane protein